MRKIVAILVFLINGSNISAQNVNEIIETANNFYRQNEYLKAKAEYAKVLETEPTNTTVKFNMANALFKLDKKVEAAVLLNDVIKTTSDKNLLSKAWYNKGVILSNQKNIDESIEAYKNALRNNPADKEARENLQKALLELKNKKNPQKQEDQQKKEKNKQPQQQQSKMSMKEAEQRLKLLQQKEKEVQQRIQKEKVKGSGSQAKDW